MEVVKLSHPLSHFPKTAYTPAGIALRGEMKALLLGEKRIAQDFALDAWRVNAT